MRYLFLFIVYYSLAVAQDFNVTPLEQDLSLDNLASGTKVHVGQDRVAKRYLSSEMRDQVLIKYLKEVVRDMDEFDKDILYKSLISYDDQILIKKYPFLKKIDLKGLKNELL